MRCPRAFLSWLRHSTYWSIVVHESGKNGPEDPLDLLLGGGEGLARLRAKGFDLLELVDDALGGLMDVRERRPQIADLLVLEPVVGIDDFPRRGDEVFVRLPARLLLVHHAADAEAVRDAAYEIGVADFLEKRAGGGLRLDVLGTHEGRAPDLHVVDAFRLFGVVPEDDDGAVGIQAEAMARQRIVDFLPDHVVGKEDGTPGPPLVKRVEDVFAVRRADAPQKLHPFDRLLEGLRVPALQVVATWKNEPMVFWKRDARLPDGIDAVDLVVSRVEDEVAILGLAVGKYLQKDQGPDARVVHLGVVERLIAIQDWLAVDALAVLGVVLDFDGEIAVDRLHEDFVEDVHVRVATGDVIFARRQRPFEVVRGREDVIPLTTVVDVLHGVVARNGPAEDTHVFELFADLEDGEELFPRPGGAA